METRETGCLSYSCSGTGVEFYILCRQAIFCAGYNLCRLYFVQVIFWTDYILQRLYFIPVIFFRSYILERKSNVKFPGCGSHVFPRTIHWCLLSWLEILPNACTLFMTIKSLQYKHLDTKIHLHGTHVLPSFKITHRLWNAILLYSLIGLKIQKSGLWWGQMTWIPLLSSTKDEKADYVASWLLALLSTPHSGNISQLSPNKRCTAVKNGGPTVHKISHLQTERGCQAHPLRATGWKLCCPEEHWLGSLFGTRDNPSLYLWEDWFWKSSTVGSTSSNCMVCRVSVGTAHFAKELRVMCAEGCTGEERMAGRCRIGRQ